ncbi:MAG: acyl-CoA dehydrogenase family protein [Actinomycetota bacterium]|jgi:alkylation response protein AidB-like acyl-CoA dehydrogenase|nr:acyl-CoA dehydrogenase family protein [Actinomycetota bacterium]
MHGLTAEDLAVQERARGFVDSLLPYEVEAEMNGGELPGDLAERLRTRARELGLAATNMPRELGGGGCTALQQVLVQEQVGRATNALAWVVSTPPQWWPPVASAYQRDRWLVPTVRGEMSECYAITEEGAGSDVDAIASTARREGDEYVLNGVKWHVTSYNDASYAFFQAKLTAGPHAGEHAMFVVDLPSPGVRVERTPAYSHTISHHHPVVAFENVRVPASHLVGDEGGGMAYSYEWFRFERMMVAARCVGAAERLVEEATAFAKDRVVYGEPIISYQLIAGMLADSLTEMYCARSILYEAARGIDEGRDLKVQHAQASMVKLYASEMANRVADRAVQIFGGRGYMRENVAERFFRELRVERIWEGTSEIQRVIIAQQLAKRGARALA